jgi:hypothetical protein
MLAFRLAMGALGDSLLISAECEAAEVFGKYRKK